MSAAERSPTPTGSEACGKGRGAFHLDLDNFDGDDVPDDCPYVLTSPRSLEACKRLRVQVSRKLKSLKLCCTHEDIENSTSHERSD